MDKCKRILHCLLFPHTEVVVLVCLLSIAAYAVMFFAFSSFPLFLYCCYALSAYALTVVCFRIPAIVRFVKRLKSSNPWLLRLAGDPALRVRVSLWVSLVGNSAYALLQLGLAVWHRSVWFYSLAVYYLLLICMRFFLLRDIQNADTTPQKGWKRYRFCGIVLIPMNITLCGIVLYISGFGYGAQHHPITTIALAAYTFTATTVAITNAIRYKKLKSPTLTAAKSISLIAALVSMLTLESAMLAAFGGEGDALFRRAITAITGAAICAFVLMMAVYMIANAHKNLCKLKENPPT